MAENEKVVMFQDDIGKFPRGQIYYSESLKVITPVLVALNGDELKEPKYFHENIQYFLNEISQFFRGVHNTHEAAKKVYKDYRVKGHQYYLYLRSFFLSGTTINTDLEKNKAIVGFSTADYNFTQIIKKTIRNQMNSLSLVNVYDLFLSKQGSGFPSFRVLSHNWREVVSQVIKGANFIVLHLDGDTEGIKFEVDKIREYGLAQRTICVVHEGKYVDPDSFKDFFDVVEVSPWSQIPNKLPGIRNIKKSLKHLANDNFRQTNQVGDLSDLKCYVIDRNIEMAALQFDPTALLKIPYENYVPISLANNWDQLTDHFPDIVERWKTIEKMYGKGQSPDLDQLADLMYLAKGTFWLAVTLERYEEMAIAIATLGITHRFITKRTEIMADCYRYAAEYAALDGNKSSARYYKKISKELS